MLGSDVAKASNNLLDYFGKCILLLWTHCLESKNSVTVIVSENPKY